MVGARQLAQHERVEAIGLTARRTESRPRRRDLVGVHRDHRQAGVQQPLDQQPVGPLDRDALNAEPHQLPAQPVQSRLVVRDGCRPQPLPVAVLRRPRRACPWPSPPRHTPRPSNPSHLDRPSPIAGQELPLRVLIDGPSPGLRPVAACGTSPRREGQVSRGPSHRQASRALSRRWPAARPYPGRSNRKVDL